MLAALKKNGRLLEYPSRVIDFQRQRWGFVFMNMGGPETIDDIEPFLYNLFSDPYIIKLPFSGFLQKPLARLISSRRTRKVKRHYEAIGGGSPLLKWCRRVAGEVELRLKNDYQPVTTYVGMKYTPPFISDALSQAAADGCCHVVLMSLFPQYTLATTGTALADVRRWFEKNKTAMTFSVIAAWHDHPDYIKLLQKYIDEAMNEGDKTRTKLLFSAHSLPVKLVESGDPYLKQVTETVELAGAGYDYELSFQSRSGPVKWLKPETKATILKLGREGVSDLVIVPVSFVSDHIETLYEIDIELKQFALKVGIKKFTRTRSFNDDPEFIRCLTGMVKNVITDGQG
ncbi:MAG: ferrochelatase [candidate division Zixibacteria bacterium]|nr:ferrochelatase [candidate division Zixibacteria bacterium]